MALLVSPPVPVQACQEQQDQIFRVIYILNIGSVLPIYKHKSNITRREWGEYVLSSKYGAERE